MASIHITRSGGFEVHWREDGRQRTATRHTRPEAEALRKRLEAGTAELQPAGQVGQSLLAYARNVWLPGRYSMAQTTKRSYLSGINSLPTLRDRSLAWVASHREEVGAAIAASTRKDHAGQYLAVKLACDDAVARGWLEGHRLGGMDIRRTDSPRKLVRTTPDQRLQLAKALGDRELAFWLCHGLGLRIGECLGLHGSDFSDSRSVVKIQRQAQRGDAVRLKTRNSYRDIPVPSWLAERVRAAVAVAATEGGRRGDLSIAVTGAATIADGRRDDLPIVAGPLFPGRKESRHAYASYKTIGPPLKAAAESLGLEGWSVHHLRHAYATDLLERNVPVERVARYLGDSVDMVMQVYGRTAQWDEDDLMAM